jgi:hypothetical protein
LQVREQLRNKERYASGLELLLRQRNEQIDQLHSQLDQLRLKNNQSHEEAQHMAMFVGIILDLEEGRVIEHDGSSDR